jgi:SagB-type dehydrogenase family enzyme
LTDRDVVLGYHEATKHHYHRYARSLGYLDWDSQPDPFRRYVGASETRLPFVSPGNDRPYDALFTEPAVEPASLTLASLSEFLECSLGLSAWKEFQGSRWALRCNPSSGNLHPTEGYVIADSVEGLGDGARVYHYAPKEHALERRTSLPPDAWESMTQDFPDDVFFLGLTSVHWREAWKYGERAYRYCQHDVGHALAACSFTAAMLGWTAVHLDGVGDADVASLLGLNRDADFTEAEREAPDLILAVFSTALNTVPRSLSAVPPPEAWEGSANRLSAEQVDWDIIDQVHHACAKSTEDRAEWVSPILNDAMGLPTPRPVSARAIIQQRRSAVALDGQTSISRDDFYRMLARTLPACGGPPWSTIGPETFVHLGLFVHRVDGLEPGLYCLVRDPAAQPSLRDAMQEAFTWDRTPACPDGLPLYQLATGDCTRDAMQMSCGQDIAGDGAFSLGMLAQFETAIDTHGPWCYRRLFWECGAIGQVLYLEAEVAGVRGTGIGCFFDDAVHACFGIRGPAFQSLYHFTIGGPVEDTRLTTLPPYPHERTSPP